MRSRIRRSRARDGALGANRRICAGVLLGVGLLLLIVTLSPIASSAQGAADPFEPLSLSVVSAGSAAERGGVAIATGVILTTVMLATAATIHDRNRRRRRAERALERLAADALGRVPTLKEARITPIALVPLWRLTAPTLRLAGAVPELELAETALAAVRRALAQGGYRARIDDRIVLDLLMDWTPRGGR